MEFTGNGEMSHRSFAEPHLSLSCVLCPSKEGGRGGAGIRRKPDPPFISGERSFLIFTFSVPLPPLASLSLLDHVLLCCYLAMARKKFQNVAHPVYYTFFLERCQQRFSKCHYNLHENWSSDMDRHHLWQLCTLHKVYIVLTKGSHDFCDSSLCCVVSIEAECLRLQSLFNYSSLWEESSH